MEAYIRRAHEVSEGALILTCYAGPYVSGRIEPRFDQLVEENIFTHDAISVERRLRAEFSDAKGNCIGYWNIRVFFVPTMPQVKETMCNE